MAQKSNDQSAKGRRLIVGIAIVLASGTGFGAAMDNIFIGAAIGLGSGVGWAIGTSFEMNTPWALYQKQKSNAPADSDSSDANATASGGGGHADRNK